MDWIIVRIVTCRDSGPHGLEDQALMLAVRTIMLEAIQKCNDVASCSGVGMYDPVHLYFFGRTGRVGAQDFDCDVPRITFWYLVSK